MIGIDWRERLRDMLINAGTNGLKQRDIIHELERFTNADPITQHLEALLSEEKVQRFKIPTRGRPGIVWRATTKILQDVI